MNNTHPNPRSHLTALRLMNFKGIRGVDDEDGVLQPLQIELRPITLLFGPNSAGKSTILQAMAYLREVLERRNLDPDRTLVGGEYMDLGGFENLIHLRDTSKQMKLGFVLEGLEGDLPTYLSESDTHAIESQGNGPFPADGYDAAKTIRVDITIEWSDLTNRPVVTRVEQAINDVDFIRLDSSEDGRDVRIGYLDLTHPLFENLYSDFGFESDSGSVEPVDVFKSIVMESLRDNLVQNLPELTVEEMMAIKGRPEIKSIASNLPLANQPDALPKLGCMLDLAHDIWAERGPWDSPLVSQVFVQSAISGLLVGSLDRMASVLTRLLYIGPIREVPDRNLSKSRSPNAGSWARGAAAWNELLAADDKFIDKVNTWFSSDERLNSGYRIVQQRFREVPEDNDLWGMILSEDFLDADDPAALFDALPVKSRLLLRDESNGLPVQPHDVGVGISQLLPVVVAALLHDSGIVAIEQPELHIHPALQVELGDLFADRVASFGGIYLLESHSEHLMLRLLRRIRETTENETPPGKPRLWPDDVAVQYIQAVEGKTEIKRLHISEDGDFVDRWPRGFFEERDDELFF